MGEPHTDSLVCRIATRVGNDRQRVAICTQIRPQACETSADLVSTMSNDPLLPVHSSPAVRLGYVGLGLGFTGLGIIGALLPVMPTTCFLLLALWAFSKGSPRLHNWLWQHKHLGAPLRRWKEHRCIPVSAKVAAIVSMSGSLTYVLLFASLGPLALGGTVGFIGVGAFVVLRIPSVPRGRPEDCARPAAATAMATHSEAVEASTITELSAGTCDVPNS